MLYHQPSKTVCREPNFWNILKRVSGSTMTVICSLKTLVSFFSCFFSLEHISFHEYLQAVAEEKFKLCVDAYKSICEALAWVKAPGCYWNPYYISFIYTFFHNMGTKSSLFFHSTDQFLNPFSIVRVLFEISIALD